MTLGGAYHNCGGQDHEELNLVLTGTQDNDWTRSLSYRPTTLVCAWVRVCVCTIMFERRYPVFGEADQP